jgi:hypothetical protein
MAQTPEMHVALPDFLLSPDAGTPLARSAAASEPFRSRSPGVAQ